MQDDEVTRQIGIRLKASRKAAKLTQEDVAKDLGVNRQAVSMWETGKALPRGREWYRLGPLLGVSLDYLVYGVRMVPASQSPMIRAILGAAPDLPTGRVSDAVG